MSVLIYFLFFATPLLLNPFYTSARNLIIKARTKPSIFFSLNFISTISSNFRLEYRIHQFASRDGTLESERLLEIFRSSVCLVYLPRGIKSDSRFCTEVPQKSVRLYGMLIPKPGGCSMSRPVRHATPRATDKQKNVTPKRCVCVSVSIRGDGLYQKRDISFLNLFFGIRGARLACPLTVSLA